MLMELARQYLSKENNNGRLIATEEYLRPRGWKSKDTIIRCLRELTDAMLIHQTYKAHRPNKASWYALTWITLGRHSGYDVGAAESFKKGAYLKNAILSPIVGVESTAIGPIVGVENPTPTPIVGPIEPVLCPSSTPTIGLHLEKPSMADSLSAAGKGRKGRVAQNADEKPPARPSRRKLTEDDQIGIDFGE
jgi:hypothetical protein